METYSRVYAKIDLDAIRFNLDSIKKKLSKDTKIIAVLKTDGYGHGGVEIAREIEEDDALWGFAVATAQEAFQFRNHHIHKPILILGYSFLEDYEKMVEQEIRPAVFTFDMAKALSKAAVGLRKTAEIHIKIDTGMSRIGYQVTEESADEIAAIAALPGIHVEGMFTHFARADETDKSAAKKQMEWYQDMVHKLEKRQVSIPIRHCSNSAGIAELPWSHLDAVRAGIILYGLWPSDEVSRASMELHPVMELKSRIVCIKTLEAGRTVSYGGTYQLKEPRRIATIPVGYGDGYPRSLSNKGYVLIHGKKAPILGRVCMDQFMVDVTEIPQASLLDEVTLLGRDGGEVLTMEELGALSGRFNYEFACDMGKRIPRIFYKNNKMVSFRDYFA